MVSNGNGLRQAKHCCTYGIGNEVLKLQRIPGQDIKIQIVQFIVAAHRHFISVKREKHI